MSRFAAHLDSCVLVPVALADTLLRLAEWELYRPLWSGRILDEMVTAIERVHPELADGRARRRADAMAAALPDACVRGWEPLIAGIELPDPADRRVVGAALRGRADVIVTANTKDFPATVMDGLGIEIQTPDTFLLNQLDLAPTAVVACLHDQSTATRRPPLTLDVLLDRLAASGVPRFAEAARHQRWRVSG